jgi:Reverse transcriptase (RNA-dependent DNA polymerase)
LEKVENVTVPIEVNQVPVPEPDVPVSKSSPLRRSTRAPRAQDRLNLLTDDVFTFLFLALCDTTPPVHQASTITLSDSFKASISDPDTLTWDQEMKDIPNLEEWIKAMKEIVSLEKHGTWVIDNQCNATSKILPVTWVFRIKRALYGDFPTDLYETYAPVVGWSTIQLFLILSLLLHWTTKSINCSQAFVQAILGYTVWIHLPRGFHTTEGTNKCLKLVKSL